MFRLAPFVSALLLFPALSLAEGPVQVDAWARATPPGGTSGAIYGTFTNQSESPVSLESVDIALARHVMVHRTVVEDGVMKMKHEDVVIEPGQTVVFEPGGLHVMLMGLSSPLKQGCLYSVTMHWGDGSVTEHPVNTGGYGQSSAPEAVGLPCP